MPIQKKSGCRKRKFLSCKDQILMPKLQNFQNLENRIEKLQPTHEGVYCSDGTEIYSERIGGYFKTGKMF